MSSSSSSKDVEEGEDATPTTTTRKYTANHLTVLLKPVCITMLLTAICVVNVRTDSLESSLSSGLSAYTYYDEDSGSSGDKESGGEVFGKALINSLIIIGAVIAMTFFIVVLFYFRCYKTLAGFIMFTTVIALGYNFAFILMAAIDKYSVTIDWITFLFILYNFAVVGVIAIFYKKGTPSYVGQAYLIIVSLTIAYLLSFLPEWTGWVLLVTLAFYDLCAVLTPCGPLKALVNMAQSRNDGIPGLLYEAQVEDDGAEDDDEEEEHHVVPNTSSSSSSVRKHGEPTKSSAADQVKTSSSKNSTSNNESTPSVVPRHTRRPRRVSSDEDEDEEGDHVYGWDNSVKLGLGDFIFYSLLVSKAALMGFLPFATCFVSIIEGLVLTMLLLAVVQAALPALPFSMLLGVACFFFSAYVLEPEYVYPLQSHGVFA